MENDTGKLLEACNEGIKMGVESIEEVLGRVGNEKMKTRLEDCRLEHQKLRNETGEYLKQMGTDAKEPNPIAKGMSWMKTEMKLAVETSDEMIADLMTDGCNMGVKTLSRYLNRYPNANGTAVELTSRVIRSEEALAKDMRAFL